KEEINNLLTQYVEELDAVKLRAGLAQRFPPITYPKDNLCLQANKLDGQTASKRARQMRRCDQAQYQSDPPSRLHYHSIHARHGSVHLFRRI
ncbi:hypothetical protein EMPG_11755, partial [Blastomyces silverae]